MEGNGAMGQIRRGRRRGRQPMVKAARCNAFIARAFSAKVSGAVRLLKNRMLVI